MDRDQAMAAALREAMISGGDCVITCCVGEPTCRLKEEDAVAAMMAGCARCERVVVGPAGRA